MARPAGLEPATPGLEGRFLVSSTVPVFRRSRTCPDSTSCRSVLNFKEPRGSSVLQNHLQRELPGTCSTTTRPEAADSVEVETPCLPVKFEIRFAVRQNADHFQAFPL